MATRMQRYYQNGNAESERRSQKNKRLYKDIYESGNYTNIEGIASIGDSNAVDIEKIKEMLQGKKQYQKRREYHKTPPLEEAVETPMLTEIEERNYDIRDILVKARETMPKDNKERVLRDNKYDFLNKLQKEKTQEENEDDLKELINTITSTSMLNKLGNETLAKELFSDLTSEKEEPRSLKEYIQEQENEKEKNKEQTLDESFFTSSLNLNKADFEEVDEEDKRKTSVFSIIIIIILVLVIVGCIGILIYKRLM